MASSKHESTEMSSSEEKKQKVEEKPAENDGPVFRSIGEQAAAVDAEQGENVEYISSDTLRNTGAEDAEGRPVQEIESLCMNCHEQGVTRLLFTTIPNFREIVIMSFECPHCNYTSNEIQTAEEIAEKGASMTVMMDNLEDFNRQVLKTQYAVCKFPSLDIEIPAGTGRMTTIEGLLSGMKEDLEGDQPVRKHVNPDLYEKIETVLKTIESALAGEKFPLKFILDDASGNSFVAYQPEEFGNKWVKREYFRTPAQCRAIGMMAEEDNRNESVANKILTETATENDNNDDNVPQEMREEVQTFHATCPSCHAPTPTHMKVVNIPHFKDVIIMSTVCSECGYKSNEVKTGGAVPDKGRRIKLNVIEAQDLSRDILKSETCHLRFPELDLDLAAGTLGGRFTTIEGLLRQVAEELESKVISRDADSMDQSTKERWASFLARLETAVEGNLLPFTVFMEDPLAASYIQNVYAPDEDPEMTIEDYERTFDENEDLGLNDMNTEQHA